MELIKSDSEQPEDKAILLDPGAISGNSEPDMRIVGLFADVNEEKIAEILHNMLFFNEQCSEPQAQPITFYISTWRQCCNV